MVIQMLFTMRQRLWAAGQSLAGDGMLLRLRNASIAMVAVVAAVGLGLTLFIAQLGFPGVFSSPIPGSPREAGSVHDAIALTHGHRPAVAPSSPALSRRTGAVSVGNPHHAGRHAVGNGNDGGRGGSRQAGVSPGTPRNPAGQPAAPVPVSAPAAPPGEPAASAPSPASVPAVVESPSKPSSDGQSKGVSGSEVKPNAPSSAKATSDGSGKSEGYQTTKSDGNTVSVAKPNSAPAEKADKDQGAASAPKTVAPPPPPPPSPPAKPAPEMVSPAAAKEATYGGKLDRPHH
jgi:hypothetical protein